MLDKVNAKWLDTNSSLVFIGILFFSFLSMLGHIVTQNSFLLFVCAASGFISYLLLALASLLYKEQKLYVALFAALLPLLIYILTVAESLITWVGPVITIFGVFVLARSLVRYDSWRYGFELLAVLGFFMVLGAHLMVSDLPGFWAELLNPYLDKVKAGSEQISIMKQALPARYTGISVFFNFLLFPMFCVNCVKTILQRIDKNILKKVASGVMFSKTLTFILIGLSVANIWFRIDFLVDLQIIWLMACMVVGLSFVHEFLKQHNKKYLLLSVIYVVLFLPGNLFVSMLTILGILDSGFNLRKKFIN